MPFGVLLLSLKLLSLKLFSLKLSSPKLFSLKRSSPKLGPSDDPRSIGSSSDLFCQFNLG